MNFCTSFKLRKKIQNMSCDQKIFFLPKFFFVSSKNEDKHLNGNTLEAFSVTLNITYSQEEYSYNSNEEKKKMSN